jgi:ACS family hexuronate transporter-like MFS transporter
MDLLHDRRVVALVLARLVSDPVWWFFVAWTPKYLYSQRGFSLKEIGLYAWIPFVAGSLGGLIGGKASDTLIRRGMNAASARLRVLYVSAAFAPMGILISRVPTAGVAIALIGGMALVVYSWFINTAALIPDVLPAGVVGSVLGLMGTAGSVGGFLFTRLVGFLLTHYSYTVVFLLAGSMHLLASLILWTLMKDVT